MNGTLWWLDFICWFFEISFDITRRKTQWRIIVSKFIMNLCMCSANIITELHWFVLNEIWHNARWWSCLSCPNFIVLSDMNNVINVIFVNSNVAWITSLMKILTQEIETLLFLCWFEIYVFRKILKSVHLRLKKSVQLPRQYRLDHTRDFSQKNSVNVKIVVINFRMQL